MILLIDTQTFCAQQHTGRDVACSDKDQTHGTTHDDYNDHQVLARRQSI